MSCYVYTTKTENSIAVVMQGPDSANLARPPEHVRLAEEVETDTQACAPPDLAPFLTSPGQGEFAAGEQRRWVVVMVFPWLRSGFRKGREVVADPTSTDQVSITRSTAFNNSIICIRFAGHAHVEGRAP